MLQEVIEKEFSPPLAIWQSPYITDVVLQCFDLIILLELLICYNITYTLYIASLLFWQMIFEDESHRNYFETSGKTMLSDLLIKADRVRRVSPTSPLYLLGLVPSMLLAPARVGSLHAPYTYQGWLPPCPLYLPVLAPSMPLVPAMFGYLHAPYTCQRWLPHASYTCQGWLLHATYTYQGWLPPCPLYLPVLAPSMPLIPARVGSLHAPYTCQRWLPPCLLYLPGLAPPCLLYLPGLAPPMPLIPARVGSLRAPYTCQGWLPPCPLMATSMPLIPAMVGSYAP